MKQLYACLVFFSAVVAGVSGAQIEVLLPFATADGVRVEAAISAGEQSGPIQLTGKIVAADDKKVLWEGTIGAANLQAGTTIRLTNTIDKLRPRLWNPDSPVLYYLEVEANNQRGTVATNSARFGFRSFGQRDGQFILNGRPIFLRGVAINPPGRTIPAETGGSRQFAQDYVRCMKAAHVNIIRLWHDSQVWFDVCDEMGMMVYQGVYASPPGSVNKKKEAPTDIAASVVAYKTLFSTYVRHPSVVIYVLANELPTSGKRGQSFASFLDKACATLKDWDSTHQYIANAGYGEGRQGDIDDVHRYWGWYYNTFLTFYNLRAPHLFGDPEKIQPLTFSECIGSFTGPVGGFNIIVRKQLGPQLNWTGHSPDQEADASAYQCLLVREVTEAFRRLRPLNPHIAGLMPFSIFFANWEGIKSFVEMHPTAALAQLGRSYQPVLLSWELWQRQVYAGSILQPIAHVVNDADNGGDLTNASLTAEIRSADGRLIAQSTQSLDKIPYYGTRRNPLRFDLPADLPTGEYTLSGKILAEGREISSNSLSVFVASREWDSESPSAAPTVSLFDPAGHTAAAFRRLKIDFKSVATLGSLEASTTTLVIGEEALAGNAGAHGSELKRFMRGGGRILCLRQDEKMDVAWLPESIHFFTASANDPQYPVRRRPFAGNMSVNIERPDHPVFFNGLDRHQFQLWSDYTGWDLTKPGFPSVYPVTAGFALDKKESLEHTAILADYDRALEGIALCEMFEGKGSVILSAFDLVNRAGLDPIAGRLLRNLVNYAATAQGHFIYPLMDQPIAWGNYGSERGLITGPLNGLIVNADWVVPPTKPDATPLTQEKGEWNSRPGDTFLPQGRSPFGPYDYSPAATPISLNKGDKVGHGYFWARIPAGKKFMLTTVKNPAADEGSLRVDVNHKEVLAPTVVPSGQTVALRAPLPVGTESVAVEFTGAKTLVLLETRFE